LVRSELAAADGGRRRESREDSARKLEILSGHAGKRRRRLPEISYSLQEEFDRLVVDEHDDFKRHQGVPEKTK
jgi:hypothetical protein